MNKEQLQLLPENDKRGRKFDYIGTHAQQAVAGAPPAYHSVQVSSPTYEQPVGLSAMGYKYGIVLSFKYYANGNPST